MSTERRFDLEGLLGMDAVAAIESVRTGAKDKGFAHLEIHFASLPRRAGQDLLAGPAPENLDEGVVDLRGWRRCDIAAALVLGETPPTADELWKLYTNGDAEERRMVLRTLPFRAVDQVTKRLLVEAHRTNDEAIFISAFADSDLPARALDDDDYNRGVLKAAFIDLPLARLLRCRTRANAELTSMLLDFMTEREAAMRPVWHGSLELGAHAPAGGLSYKISGDLWSGVDARRLDAARAAVIVDDETVKASAALRHDVEPRADVRRLLERASA